MTGLEKLQEIGAHNIYEKTHIAKKFVEDILNQRFSTMSKIQFTGFISIIEREYSVDLHELTEAFAAELNRDTSESEEPFSVSQRNEGGKQTKGIYIISGLLVMLLSVIILKSVVQEEKAPISISKTVVEKEIPLKNELNNTTIKEAKLNLSSLENDSVITKPDKLKNEVKVEPVHLGKFEIIPRSKLWIGIVDLETFQHSQKLGSASFELDQNKSWLLVMGHGFVNFSVNGEEQSFKDENKVWFGYEDGVLSKLSRSEFKEKNRGKAW